MAVLCVKHFGGALQRPGLGGKGRELKGLCDQEWFLTHLLGRLNHGKENNCEMGLGGSDCR